MIGLFGKIKSHKTDEHHQHTGNDAAPDKRQSPALLKKIQENQINERQGSPNHIGNGCGRGGPQVSAKLLGAHRNKDGPEARGKSKQGADHIHPGILIIVRTEKQDARNHA